jgi:2,4-dienoyl-CoA reductase-like NADH-dependent reductase (Old Yellow Enzyme family)/thioredoxin reductase
MSTEILARSLQLGAHTARNRLGMSPMCANLGDSLGHVTQRVVDYYETRARGGVGLVIVENAHVDDVASRGMSAMLSVHSDGMVPGLNALAESITRHGALAVLQINHMGRQGDPTLIDGSLLAPSAEADPVVGAVPQELDLDDIAAVRESFAAAAARAIHSGFHGVEVHFAHGYLLSEFLSPHSNRRTDAYGGSLENRMRLPLEVLGAVREHIGPSAIMGVRMNGDDYLGDRGLTGGEVLDVATAVERAGADYINVSAAVYESVPWMVPPIYFPPATNIHLAARVSSRVSIPVLGAGSIMDRTLAQDVLTSGKADMVLLGRAMIADPELPSKWLRGDDDAVLRCIRCNDACIQRLLEKKRVTCTVNVLAGHEREWALEPVTAERRRHVMVAGGGPAGLEAARVAATRGHRVTLCEKEPELGGQVRYGCLPPFKTDLRQLVPYYERRLAALGVDVRTNTEVTSELVDELVPDVALVATGADHAVPAIPGIERGVLGRDIHVDPGVAGMTVVVIGAGLVGCEAALELALEGRDVVVVEEAAEPLSRMNIISKYGLLGALNERGVRILTGTRPVAVGDASVRVTDASGATQELPADTVVIAAGLVPRRGLAETLTTRGLPVREIGDCVSPKNIMAAIHAGFHAGREV